MVWGLGAADDDYARRTNAKQRFLRRDTPTTGAGRSETREDEKYPLRLASPLSRAASPPVVGVTSCSCKNLCVAVVLLFNCMKRIIVGYPQTIPSSKQKDVSSTLRGTIDKAVVVFCSSRDCWSEEQRTVEQLLGNQLAHRNRRAASTFRRAMFYLSK